MSDAKERPQKQDVEAPPERGEQHAALDIFVGKWEAHGTSFGGTDQSGDPRANGEPWESTHENLWHAGGFFLRTDERAKIADRPFDMIGIVGVDADTGDYFASTFENHGFERRYNLSNAGNVWTLAGATERAITTFGDDNLTQTIMWEWKRDARWLPLCDRIARRID